MRKLSQETKERIDSDLFYRQCCLCRSLNPQMHHNLIYAGKQVDDAECILPLCENCHDKARNSEVREKLDWIMFLRMRTVTFNKYSKGDLLKRYAYISKKFNDKI